MTNVLPVAFLAFLLAGCTAVDTCLDVNDAGKATSALIVNLETKNPTMPRHQVVACAVESIMRVIVDEFARAGDTARALQFAAVQSAAQVECGD